MALSPSYDLLPPEAKLYFHHMLEVKRRFLAIDRILGAKRGTSRTLNSETDDEFMWLQVRKIIELVTYSAIASDLDRYTALRAQSNNKVEDERKAPKILTRLSGINPRFMPLPLGQMTVLDNGIQRFEGVELSQRATLDRMKDIFDEASKHLHAANPYVEDARELEQAQRNGSRVRLLEAKQYLKAALWDHYKIGLEFKSGDDPKGLDNPKTAYIIYMQKPELPDVRILLAYANSDERPELEALGTIRLKA